MNELDLMLESADRVIKHLSAENWPEEETARALARKDLLEYVIEKPWGFAPGNTERVEKALNKLGYEVAWGNKSGGFSTSKRIVMLTRMRRGVL